MCEPGRVKLSIIANVAQPSARGIVKYLEKSKTKTLKNETASDVGGSQNPNLTGL